MVGGVSPHASEPRSLNLMPIKAIPISNHTPNIVQKMPLVALTPIINTSYVESVALRSGIKQIKVQIPALPNPTCLTLA